MISGVCERVQLDLAATRDDVVTHARIRPEEIQTPRRGSPPRALLPPGGSGGGNGNATTGNRSDRRRGGVVGVAAHLVDRARVATAEDGQREERLGIGGGRKATSSPAAPPPASI